ncbi:hypothetical protein SPRG_07530 [Saprolegnia parasitica CBS 223.65]|uniref:SCP domain-containing protein n=1 Tax=Saprolegnia parasitica (strain CBS 223.65) TaxID=695850 RepID=A0A067CL67_SAPPC|nr:hypothetical protein SPRG_07530 [Saprolegnia parasitica CBS 223.65]KDO27281.1 hypothetical protein SPRG_07530 [Saprolegnia parasitica CBS 223.65]|eukprot:XP_012202056.1 hypothetical protein SPRG_07530 [Saprolegnia parasitica CBS 223.65]
MQLSRLIVCVVAAVVSGVASASCGPIEANIDYWGNDIKQTQQSAADRCCADCAATANCVVATWRAGTCYLKHTKANRYSSDGAMSISPNPTSTCGAIENDVDYYGNDIKQTKQASASGCCADCAATPNCVVYTWRDGTCYLKHTKANRYTSTGVRSASRSSSAPSQVCAPIEENIDYYGNDIKFTTQPNADACCADCAATPNCVVYTWRDYGNGDTKCWLKSAKGSRGLCNGARSASIQSSSNLCRPIEENTDYPGNDIARLSRGTAGECCDDCRARSDCVVSVWYAGLCYLKNAKGNKVYVSGRAPRRWGQIVRQLNLIRKAHGYTTPVVWDEKLAADMQAWADSCPQKNGGGHGGPPGAQNLASYEECKTNCHHQVGASWNWYDSEQQLWSYERDACANGDWMTCGHFQNSMNKGVSAIGCGWSTCYNPNINGQDSLIWCNYIGVSDPPQIPRPKMAREAILASLTA